MKILNKAIKNADCLVFMDLEATALSHELIEIGAYRVLLHDDGTPKKIHPPFKRYVKAKSPIGKIVVDMTGITEETLKRNAIPFEKAMEDFRDYVGNYWKSARFLTFGPHDMVILHSTMAINRDANPEFVRHISGRYLDFQGFLSQYIQDRNGNPLSLSNYLKTFELSFEGQEHDACADAYNLYRLYESLFKRKDVLIKQYEMTLSHNHKLPTPLKEAFRRLNEGEDLTVEKWRKAIGETFE